MTQITEEWINSIKLAKGVKDTLFLLQIAASIDKMSELEKEEYLVLYLDIIEYLRDYCRKKEDFDELELVRIIDGAKTAISSFDECILPKSELAEILSAYKKI